MPRPSIARRLLAWLLLAYFLAWGSMLVIGQLSLRAAGSGEFDRDMVALSDVVETVLAESGAVNESTLHGVVLELTAEGRRMGVANQYLAIAVHDAAGRLLANAGSPTYAASAGNGFFELDAAGDRWHVYRRWTKDGSKYIDISQSDATRSQVVDAVLMHPTTAAQVVIGFAVLFFPLLFAVRAGLEPLSRLSARLSARHPDDLRPIDYPGAPVELASILQGLNGTLEKLRHAMAREREFLADAAHELRTPLAVIAAQSESLRLNASDATDEAALAQLARGVRRATRAVNQLMTLARLESDADERPRAFDLADFVRDSLALFFDEARAAGVELQYVGPDRFPVECRAYAMESILHNLVSNAIRHGAVEGGTIEVRVGRSTTSDALVVSVSDDGAGVDPEDYARLFQRFRRGPASAQATTGFGLGLSIVKAAAHRLGAQLTWGPGLGSRGLRVALELPVGAELGILPEE